MSKKFFKLSEDAEIGHKEVERVDFTGCRLTCPKCKNTRTFYKKVNMTGKLRVDRKGINSQNVEIDKIDFDYEYQIFCAKCDELVSEI